MPPARETRIRTFGDVLEEAKRIHFSLNSMHLWYRGHADESYRLEPSIYRSGRERARAERDYALEFLARARSRYPACPANDDYVAWLTIMRYYRLPTRLLDWTESLAVATYFAVKGYKQSEDKADGQIWLLHPGRLNESQGFDPGLFSIQNRAVVELAEQVFRGSAGRSTNNASKTVAFVGQDIDRRMTMQHSMFTIHGSSKFTEKTETQDSLQAMIIPRRSKRRIQRELQILGVHEATLFPDLEHLGKWVPDFVVLKRLSDLGYLSECWDQ